MNYDNGTEVFIVGTIEHDNDINVYHFKTHTILRINGRIWYEGPGSITNLTINSHFVRELNPREN